MSFEKKLTTTIVGCVLAWVMFGVGWQLAFKNFEGAALLAIPGTFTVAILMAMIWGD